MTILDFVLLAVIAAIAGAIGQALAGYSMGGCLVSAVVGYIGAIIGFWLSRSLHLPEPFLIIIGNQAFPLLWSIVGSLVLALIVGFVSGRRQSLI
jgi:uncharacterized membrane protein YeaQ/YmgE (transglycosylase-associated protein family)